MAAEGTALKTTILLADDDDNFRSLCALMLKNTGYSVIPVPNGTAAVAALKKRVFDLMLLDVHMPGKTGWEVLKAAVESTPKGATMPVALMMTGLTTELDLDHLKRQGAAGMLIKPFSSDALVVEVERVLAAPREIKR